MAGIAKIYNVGYNADNMNIPPKRQVLQFAVVHDLEIRDDCEPKFVDRIIEVSPEESGNDNHRTDFSADRIEDL